MTTKRPLKPEQKILEAILAENRNRFPEDLDPGAYFEMFVAEQIMKDSGLDFDELEAGITDGEHDGGFDSIYLSLDNKNVGEDSTFDSSSKSPTLEIDLIQSKTAKGFKEACIDNFIANFPELFDIGNGPSTDFERYSTDVLAKAEIFHEVFEKNLTKHIQVEFRFWYVSKGTEVQNNTQKKVPALQKVVTDLYDNAGFEFHFVTAADLNSLFHKVPSQVRVLKFSKHLATDGSYVCLAKIRDMYQFISSSDELTREIFESNVRDHQGNTAVNKAIRETLRGVHTPDFWHLNNGVTILTPKATQESDKIKITDPQIVNGLQTSTELFNHFSGMSDEEMSNDDRDVLVRIIDEDEDDARDRIIRATNSQNSLPAASLRSSDLIHRDIEDYFSSRKWYYDRKKNKWKNEGKPSKNIVSIVYLAQAVMSALLGKPNDARARPSNLINSDDTYNDIFSSALPPEIYFNCAVLSKKVENILRLKVTGENSRRTINNVRFYVLHHYVESQRGTKSRKKFLTDLDVAKVTDGALIKSMELVLQLYEDLGGNDQIAKGRKLLEAIAKPK
ncbi:hypothetical protein L53_12620 [Hyphomonas sp. L-53-1-40]|uniref:AIPR family protein n=1 Tax=Hyphomonas sp. L-53-1-40 TaxID=1207058 RepID=UPI000458BD57|nr:AIPR family protein [Hyphomonas sp. L-53-1-40]KCZ62084.1 hypothetical protein L53_12620 [Hyphomonas sp. L-53-1-40]